MIEVINKNQNESEITIRISGKFIFKMYKEFSHVYLGTKGKYDKYILDMKETKYMDSSILGMLLQMREYLDTSKDNIHIINCNPYLMSIFKISNFDRLFTIKNEH